MSWTLTANIAAREKRRQFDANLLGLTASGDGPTTTFAILDQ